MGFGVEMKWYQHESSAHNDELMRELIHRFGLEGYGVYVVCLELISEKIDQKLEAKITILDSVLREKLRVSHQKLTKILAFFDQNSLIFSNFQDKKWILECPNLLKRLDNWTKRYAVTKKQVSIEREREVEKEVEGEEPYSNYIFSLIKAKEWDTLTGLYDAHWLASRLEDYLSRGVFSRPVSFNRLAMFLKEDWRKLQEFKQGKKSESKPFPVKEYYGA